MCDPKWRGLVSVTVLRLLCVAGLPTRQQSLPESYADVLGTYRQESGFISECRHLWVRFRANPTSLIWSEQCTHSNTLVTEVVTI